jgi:hypothetical protein
VSNELGHSELLAIVDQADGVIEDWRFARRLHCSTRDLARRMESQVGNGYLRRFQNKLSMPCYELTEAGREFLGAGEERAA